jgi:hypothetical protein
MPLDPHTKPAGHVRHVELPAVLYVPASQAAQVALLVAPSTALAVPALQDEGRPTPAVQ